jgi:putative cytoplasmic protein
MKSVGAVSTLSVLLEMCDMNTALPMKIRKERSRIIRMTAEEKRKAEMATVKKMLEIYCRAHHGNNLSLCEECEALFDYARARVERCPHMETKTFCSACQTHCYAPKMREKIREAMRYSGPRMLLHAPVMALRHMFIEWREKRR